MNMIRLIITMKSGKEHVVMIQSNDNKEIKNGTDIVDVLYENFNPNGRTMFHTITENNENIILIVQEIESIKF